MNQNNVQARITGRHDPRKFVQVGDWAICCEGIILDHENGINVGGAGWRRNRVFKVKEITNLGRDDMILWPEGKQCNGIYWDWARVIQKPRIITSVQMQRR